MMPFYEPQVRNKLQDLLRCAAPKLSPEWIQHYIFELDQAAIYIFAEYEMYKGGQLNKAQLKLKKIKALCRLLKKVDETLSDADIKDALAEYGEDFSTKAIKDLCAISRAALFYENRNKYTPRGIKSEGGKGKTDEFRGASSELANACFNDFLIMASSIWYKATSCKQAPAKNGEDPAGQYSKFIFEATIPVCCKFNSFHSALISDSWASIMQRLSDRNRLGVKYIKLINP